MATKTTKTEKEKESAVKLVKELVEQLLTLMGSRAKPAVKEDKENDALVVDIQTEEEAGLLIGNRGRTLSHIQTVLGMMVRQKTGSWKRIIVNVADWREREERRLNELALQTAERVKVTGEPQPLYNLTPSQRRVIHLALAGNSEIQTESHGEGGERYLLVSPKK